MKLIDDYSRDHEEDLSAASTSSSRKLPSSLQSNRSQPFSASSFLYSMLAIDTSRRPSASASLLHPYLLGIKKTQSPKTQSPLPATRSTKITSAAIGKRSAKRNAAPNIDRKVLAKTHQKHASLLRLLANEVSFVGT